MKGKLLLLGSREPFVFPLSSANNLSTKTSLLPQILLLRWSFRILWDKEIFNLPTAPQLRLLPQINRRPLATYQDGWKKKADEGYRCCRVHDVGTSNVSKSLRSWCTRSKLYASARLLLRPISHCYCWQRTVQASESVEFHFPGQSIQRRL